MPQNITTNPYTSIFGNNGQNAEREYEPVNAFTGRAYYGDNKARLQEAAAAKGYASPQWATLKQWNRLKETIGKGEKGTAIILKRQTVTTDGEAIQTEETAFVFHCMQLESAKVPSN